MGEYTRVFSDNKGIGKYQYEGNITNEQEVFRVSLYGAAGLVSQHFERQTTGQWHVSSNIDDTRSYSPEEEPDILNYLTKELHYRLVNTTYSPSTAHSPLNKNDEALLKQHFIALVRYTKEKYPDLPLDNEVEKRFTKMVEGKEQAHTPDGTAVVPTAIDTSAIPDSLHQR